MAQSNLEERVRGEIFLEPEEKLLCTAGSQDLEQFLAKGKTGRSFAVLSDRAIYCKGRCRVSRDRRKYQSKNLDFRIDLEEFQGLKYLQHKNQVLLTLAFFFLLLGPTLVLLDKLSHFGDGIVLNPILDGAVCVLLAGVFFLLYSIHKQNLLELLHTNGSICLDLRAMPEKEERLFIRYLRAFLNSRENPSEPDIPESLTELNAEP